MLHKAFKQFAKSLFDSLRDLLPIILVIGFFQIIVLQQSFPNPLRLFGGTIMVVIGLSFFIYGLKLSLFPVGESMAINLARKGSVPWLLSFAFALGFGTTIAEPALIAIASEAANVAAQGGMILTSHEAKQTYADGLRLTVALSVGISIMISVLRIIRGWPIQYFIMGGYAGVVIMTSFSPPEVIGIAYDSGGVATSTITVPLVTALGIGLASSIQGRNPMTDGFGVIALAVLTPIIGVMAYGILL